MRDLFQNAHKLKFEPSHDQLNPTFAFYHSMVIQKKYRGVVKRVSVKFETLWWA